MSAPRSAERVRLALGVACSALIGCLLLKHGRALAQYRHMLQSFDPFLGSSREVERNGKWLQPHGTYRYKWMHPVESVFRPGTSWWLVQLFRDHWTASVALALLYYVGVVWLLQRWMRPRPALRLRWSLVLWNVALGLFSMAGAYRVHEEYIHVLKTDGIHASICRLMDPRGPTIFWSSLFAASKLLELGDTVFLVLRKKPVIFLHYFHHMYVMIIAFQSVAELAAPTQTFMLLNYVAHSLMYPYYAISSAGLRLPKPISAGVTCVQIAQMFVGLFVAAYSTYAQEVLGQDCNQTRFSLLLSYIGYASFAVLFLDFFRKAYIKKKKAD